MTQAKKAPAARLTLGGAPESWHTVVGLPRHYHPSLPTPLDQPGLPPLAVVEAFLAAHPAAPVELVEIDLKDVDRLSEQARDQTTQGARAAAAARRAGDGETPHVKAQTAAVSGE